MAGAMFERLPSYFDQFNDQSLLIFTSSDTHNQFLVTDSFAVSKHTDEMCQSRTCQYHILLHTTDGIENFILKKLSQLSFNYSTVDALYGMFKYYISGDQLIACQGQVMESLQSAVRYNRFHPHMDSRPSVLKKRLLRKKTKFHSCDTKCKTLGTQTSKQSFTCRVDTILKGDFAAEFLQIVDFLIDQHGNVESKKLSFFCK